MTGRGQGTSSAGRRRQLDVGDYVGGVRAGDRMILGRALTLVESDRPEHQRQAQQVLNELLPQTGGARRVGISGVPGVGKSTFIDHLGMMLTGRSHRVAVLAVDPSSAVSGGSILGDKTRMPHLAKSEAAFIRPSPSGGTLGGVARKTREAMLLCEAAGFDVVIVETVGVGQSEMVVADMVDTFLLLMLTGGGDELQGIKRGILELADLFAINKADGDNLTPARRARKELQTALHMMRGDEAGWKPEVLLCSGLEGTGIDEVWAKIEEHGRVQSEQGALEDKRQRQKVRWMWRVVEDRVMQSIHEDPRVPQLEADVRNGRLSPTAAADQLLAERLGAERG